MSPSHSFAAAIDAAQTIHTGVLMKHPALHTAAALLALCAGLAAPAQAEKGVAAVSEGDALPARAPGRGDTDWPMYNRDYLSQRYSALKQINKGNVAQLKEVCRV